MNRAVFALFVVLASLLSGGLHRSAVAQQAAAQVVVLDRAGQPAAQISDGNRLSLRLVLPQKVSAQIEIVFRLEGLETDIARCTLPAESDTCTTPAFDSLGWYWNPDGASRPQRVVEAVSNGSVLARSAALAVRPRPVVMVHGFASSWEAWTNYLGPQGYLASIGVAGFAVGDGQTPGAMNTGRIDNPLGPTNTIHQNAGIVQQTIQIVKQRTGAEKVDLISHSMGGLISRYYIDQYMLDRDVGLLIMLGTPQNGTDCANLPASLGFYLPATLEIQPGYVVEVFNRQVIHRRGVQFFAVAGVPITEAFKSPCTSVPSDIAVSLDSASSLPIDVKRLPLLHTTLNVSGEVFTQYVRPLLQKPPGGFDAGPDPLQPAAAGAPQQFSRVYHGHLDAGASQEFTIPIEAGVSVASFALYDKTISLITVVTGASGQTIALSAEKNGLVIVDDPASLVHLGYGFANPKAGLWKINLQTSANTPAGGADYAFSARFEGGALLDAQARPTLPKPGQPVILQAQMTLGGQPLEVRQAQALIRKPDGATETVVLAIEGGTAALEWTPPSPGLYSIDISLAAQPPAGSLPEGALIEREAFLAVEAQPQENRTGAIINLSLVIGSALLTILLVGGLVIWSLGRILRKPA